jgi:SP family general alpha glucoside:H+ symporter-like MFS transporter
MVFKFLSITLELVATANKVYFGGIFLSGFCAGGFGTLSMTYIGEISPQKLRGVLTAAAPISMTLGSLIASLIINFTGDQQSHWAYRTAFASEYSFAGFATLFLPFIPESPWWLADKEKDDKALNSLGKLGYTFLQAEQQLGVIKRTLSKAREETKRASYLECFRRSNLRRTIVSSMPLAIHALCGVSFVASYSTYYQQLAGYSTQASFHLSIVQGILSLVGNICSWFLIDRVGRRSLSFWGLTLLTLLLLLTGGLAVAATPGAIKGTVALLLVYCFVFNVTIDATAYTILAEVSTPRLRVKTASMAFAFENVLFVSFFISSSLDQHRSNANKTGRQCGALFSHTSSTLIKPIWEQK